MSQSSDPSFVSAAKVAANRANARQSTGPRTPHGKAVAARNSLKHGLFARALLLPGEDAAELSELKTALLRRLNPRDPLELTLVERIVSATWKLRRLERFEARLFACECEAWDANPEHNREDHGLGRREAVPAETAWVTASPELRAQLDRLAAQERQLESALRRNLRQLMLIQETPIPEIVTDYADQMILAEQSSGQIRENEATAIVKLNREAAVEEVNEARRNRDAERKNVAERKARIEANRKAKLERRERLLTEYRAETLRIEPKPNGETGKPPIPPDAPPQAA